MLTPVLAVTLTVGLLSSTIDRLRLRMTPKRSPEESSRVKVLADGGKDGSRDKALGGMEGARDKARDGARFIGRGSSSSGESGILSCGKTFVLRSSHCLGNTVPNLLKMVRRDSDVRKGVLQRLDNFRAKVLGPIILMSVGVDDIQGGE